ncbi:hypothetical protein F5X96DRAFT_623909 [Biscogniauxia mediterranea]|nr:hypothetical protein F5X96DRAFT_623909 [Biscogniauxia mediterranea]
MYAELYFCAPGASSLLFLIFLFFKYTASTDCDGSYAQQPIVGGMCGYRRKAVCARRKDKVKDRRVRMAVKTQRVLSS